MRRKGKPSKGALRGDTTLAPVGGGGEVYVRGLPRCCLKSFKEAVVRVASDGGRQAEHRCPECGRGWAVAGSLDEKVLGRFAVARGGSGESGSAA